jgi:hypothetical protein
MQHIMALQDGAKRPEVADDEEEHAQQLEGTFCHEEAPTAAILTQKMSKKKASQPKGRRGKKAAV